MRFRPAPFVAMSYVRGTEEIPSTVWRPDLSAVLRTEFNLVDCLLSLIARRYYEVALIVGSPVCTCWSAYPQVSAIGSGIPDGSGPNSAPWIAAMG